MKRRRSLLFLPEDDSQGFAGVEKAHVRRFVPDFEWVVFDDPSPRNLIAKPLSDARIGLIVSAGAHLEDQDPCTPKGDIQQIPLTSDLQLTHIGYDTARASADTEVVVPRQALADLAAEGFIGSVADTVVSFMGFVPKGQDVLERTAPETMDVLQDEGVDLALLVPS